VGIFSEDGEHLPDGSIGEVKARSDYIVDFIVSESTQIAINKQEWYSLGDMGYRKDARLYITGRADDMLNLGGLKIDPASIEALLAEYAGIWEACVVAYPNTRTYADELGALIVRDTTGDPQFAVDSFNESSRIKITKFFVVDRLPKNVRGKLARSEIKTMFEELICKDLVN
jgi:long-chain acyl-CoA synthetase